MFWNWNTDSPVFDGIGWLQALWASRRTVCSFFSSSSLVQINSILSYPSFDTLSPWRCVYVSVPILDDARFKVQIKDVWNQADMSIFVEHARKEFY